MGKCMNVVDYEIKYRTGFVCGIVDRKRPGEGFERNRPRPAAYGTYDIDKEYTLPPDESTLLRAVCCYMNVMLGIDARMEKGVFQTHDGVKKSPYNTKIVAFLLYYAIASHGIPANEAKAVVNRQWLKRCHLEEYITTYCTLPLEASCSAGKDVNADITYMLSQALPNYVKYDASEALDNIIAVHGVFDERTHRFLGFRQNQISRLFIWNENVTPAYGHQMHFAARYFINELIMPLFPSTK